MKFFIVFCSLVALSQARSIKVDDDGTVSVIGEHGKQVIITHPTGENGERTIDIAGHGNEPAKHVKVDDDDALKSEDEHHTKDRESRRTHFDEDDDDADLLTAAYKHSTSGHHKSIYDELTDHENHGNEWKLWHGKHEHRFQRLADCISGNDNKQDIADCMRVHEKKWEHIDHTEKMVNEHEKRARKDALNCVWRKDGKQDMVDCVKEKHAKVNAEMKKYVEQKKDDFLKCMMEVKTRRDVNLDDCLRHKEMMSTMVHGMDNSFGDDDDDNMGHTFQIVTPNKVIKVQYPFGQTHYPTFGYHHNNMDYGHGY